ncbi:MAG: alanine--tRNA ligase [Bacteroidales bacterium]|nr:alanine--tRNA ligase [Candidatus Scybalousia scybalohippi]
MMTSNEIRKRFIDFFASKGHTVVPSSSMVVKNDPTLLFTNAGMNQFKDIFLGNVQKPYNRATDAQKCLRVSGKHNDLEEVGHDTYHHTMFEMLGNWSFGDYFKKEAIAYAWELLTEVYKIDKNNLYVTYFGGDEKEGLAPDNEALNYWKEWISEDRILPGNKHDNFWEMGETGPCGACSEIHIDLRSEEEKKKISGRDLVNKDNPLVIEIWNLVFMEFNRMADHSLVPLKEKNIDTGMGFERLCMVLQGKQSNYDTDVFQPLLQKIAKDAGLEYGKDEKKDIAMRVVADHLRAVSFAIADGLLPSNAKAGYVIRRILRRAVRYGYTFLSFTEPFMCNLVDTLVAQMGEQYQELQKGRDLIVKVIKEEENAFLKTLSNGIVKFEKYIADNPTGKINGDFAFELFDTYGFPVDLTELMAKEQGREIDMASFEQNLQKQKDRSRNAASVKTDDWVELVPDFTDVEFVGYDNIEAEVKIVKYRKVETKGQSMYQIVLNKTPFYAEMGGQVGDTGMLQNGEEKVSIIDTKKENNLAIHITKQLPSDVNATFKAVVNVKRRNSIERNHTATHLLHHALRTVLGSHVEQKGSYVDEKRLRFDFSHHSKMTKEEIRQVEQLVNEEIRKNILADDHRDVAIDEAREMGAMALFGEKYGDKVRVIRFGESIELCGGTHVKSTGTIGMFKVINESAVAAGIRRIEAVTGEEFEAFLYKSIDTIDSIRSFFEASPDVVNSIKKLVEENAALKKEVEEFAKQAAGNLYNDLKAKAHQNINGIDYFEGGLLPISADAMKDIAFRFRGEYKDFCFVAANEANGKVMLTIMMSDSLVEKGFDAGKMIREAAKHIKGGGGGQKYYATAGGKDKEGVNAAIQYIRETIFN